MRSSHGSTPTGGSTRPVAEVRASASRTGVRDHGSALASRRMQLVHDRIGSGPPLVLIHGIGSRRGVWKPVVKRLAREHEVIAIDLPGFGDSEPLPADVPPSVDTLTDAVVAFFAEQGLDRPHVAGNSMGGGISLELGRRGAVCSVAALSPIGFWAGWEIPYGQLMLRNVRWLTRHAGDQLTRAVRTGIGRQLALGLSNGRPRQRDPDEAAADIAAMGGSPSFDEALPRIRGYFFRDGAELKVPVTIGWGTKDRLLVPRQAERARAALPAARHVPLPGCGHVPMSDDPEGVAELLLAASA